METRRPKTRLTRLLLSLMLAFASTGLAASAHARLYADQVLPTLCKSQGLSFIGDRTEYNGTGIGVEPSGSTWDYDIVMCPINRFRPGDTIREIRIYTEGNRATNGWCQLYNAPNHDVMVDSEYPTALSGGRGKVSFDPPTSWARDGILAVTARCLLFPDNEITSIEIIWDL